MQFFPTRTVLSTEVDCRFPVSRAYLRGASGTYRGVVGTPYFIIKYLPLLPRTGFRKITACCFNLQLKRHAVGVRKIVRSFFRTLKIEIFQFPIIKLCPTLLAGSWVVYCTVSLMLRPITKIQNSHMD